MGRGSSYVVFGGAGYIGTYLAALLLETGARKIYLVDIKEPREDRWPALLRNAATLGAVQYIPADVRRPLVSDELPTSCDLIINLAAVHREPGHAPYEYYETNLHGAENVCEWAERVDCRSIVFTSSISPYGSGEAEKDERSLPVPETPYGGSKLVAEKNHIAWQRGSGDRRLVIVRPGVVFGPGEGGNVTRLVKGVLNRYFVYSGNRHTPKAGGYVKELCRAMLWVLEEQEQTGEKVTLFNFTLDPPPTVEEYVRTICRVANVRRWIPNFPFPALLGISYVIDGFSRMVGIHQPFSPMRIRNSVRPNNIIPGYLRERGYKYQYTFEEALRDWREDRPEEWGSSRAAAKPGVVAG